MGLLDNLYLGHNADFGGVGGLLSKLQTMQAQNQQYQPSTGFGQSPMDANAQQQAAPMDIGGYQMPRIGSEQQFTPDPATIPQNAQPTQGQMPMQAPQQSSGGSALTGLQSFLNGGGLISSIRGAMDGRRVDQRGVAEQQQNQTAQFLVSKGIDPAMAKTIVSDPAALRAILPSIMGTGGQTDDIKEYQFAKKEDPALTFNTFMARKKSVSGEYGMQPIWGTGADGKPAVLQLGKSGEAKQSVLPKGFQISNKPIEVDAGTHINLVDPQSRQIVGTIQKNIAGAARAAVTGKGLGEADVDLASIRSKMPGLETVVKKLDDLSGKATYTLGGQAVDFATRQAGLEPRDAAIARAEYTSMVDNQILPLLRDTFGAAFTQKEGDTLRATLGNPDMSPKEKQAILKSFIEQKRRDIEALETRTGAAPAASPAATVPDRAAIEAELRRRGKIK
jgi:hypothetical protein